MSKSNIYQDKWIDLVFENKNKEYGAYQLRHDSSKTALSALFMGLFLSASIATILFYSSKLLHTTTETTTSTPTIDDVIHVTDVNLKSNKEVLAQPEQLLAEAAASPATTVITQDQLTNPVVVTSNQAVQDIAKNSENTNSIVEPTATIGIGNSSANGSGTVLGSGSEVGTASSGSATSESTVMNSAVVDVKPTFPGGIEKFYKYVSSNFRQPDLDTDQVFRIYVSFIVEKDGSMTNIRVLQDPGYGLGREAIRVLQSLKTHWSPGMVNSKPVRTAYNLPITVKAQ